MHVSVTLVTKVTDVLRIVRCLTLARTVRRHVNVNMVIVIMSLEIVLSVMQAIEG